MKDITKKYAIIIIFNYDYIDSGFL